jgi:surface antigen
MKLLCILSLAVAAALTTSGCSVRGLGGIGPVASAPATPPAPEAPPPVVYGSFLDGPVGQKLSQADRDKALSAQVAALSSGQRKTWKGDRGVFGYVEPASAPAAAPTAPADAAAASPPAPAASESCRAFTSTIYVGGRPQVGHGRGCQNPDGTYRVVG